MSSRGKKKGGLILRIIILVGLVYLFFLDGSSIYRLVRTRMKVNKVKKQIEQYRAERDSLKTLNQELENNPKAIEKIAREKLGMQKEGEEVYRFFLEEDDEGEE